MKYNFHSNLNKEECTKRLSDKINATDLTSSDISNSTIGKVDGDNFYFELLESDGFRAITSTRRRFTGQFKSTDNGTDISGILKTSSKQNYTWIITLAVLGLFLLIATLIKGGSNPYQLVFIVVIVAGAYFIIPKESGEENIDFIKDIFDAKEVTH